MADCFCCASVVIRGDAGHRREPEPAWKPLLTASSCVAAGASRDGVLDRHRIPPCVWRRLKSQGRPSCRYFQPCSSGTQSQLPAAPSPWPPRFATSTFSHPGKKTRLENLLAARLWHTLLRVLQNRAQPRARNLPPCYYSSSACRDINNRMGNPPLAPISVRFSASRTVRYLAS